MTSLYEAFIDEFDGETFDSVEEYDEAVRRYADYLIEQTGKAERWALQHEDEVFAQMGVEIKGVYPNEEEDD